MLKSQKFKIPRHNFAAQFTSTSSSVGEMITDLLLRGPYFLSEEVEGFERAFASYVGTTMCVGVNSGTDALYLALTACGAVSRSQEVVVQANTFYATVAAICHAGATPVLVDAEESSFLIDQVQVEEAITQRTRVILPVHLYGKPTPMDRLTELASSRALSLIEDAAHAHGACWNGRRVGSFGSASCFSFNPSKNLGGAGDGGAILTDSVAIADHVHSGRAFGQDGPDNHVMLGINSKLDAIQAIVLSSKLPYLDEWNHARRRSAALYRERLADLPVTFQSCDPGESHAYHLFQVRTPVRDRLLSYLRTHGVDAVVRYPVPIHLQPAFAEFGWQRGQYPVAERLAKELLCLPIRPDITVDEVDYVCEVARSFFGVGGYTVGAPSAM